MSLKFRMLLIFSIIIFIILPIYSEAVKIATWNILNFPGSTGSDREDDFRKVVDELDLDILVVQEMLSQAGVDQFLNNVMNYSSPGTYEAAPFFDGYDTDNALFYKKSVIKLISHQQISTSLRDISEYVLEIKEGPGIGARFGIYSVHLKAGTGSDVEQQREEEATILRNYLNGLLTNILFLVSGDFNMRSSEERAFEIFIESQADNDGRTKDPINRLGYWRDNEEFADIHTQSTRTIQFGGGASGGLDDRFDLILISYGFDESEELKYKEGSYIAYGNDGEHLNNAVCDGENSAVNNDIANALCEASDHLPVLIELVPPSYIDYTLTISAGTGGTTIPQPGDYTYSPETEVSIKAVPDNNYRFKVWTGDVPSGHENDDPLTVTMDSNKSIEAKFIRQYTLTITVEEGGTTDPSPGSYIYDAGTQVNINAIPNSGYRFSGWSGNIPLGHENDNPIIIDIDSDKSIKSNFIFNVWGMDYSITVDEHNKGLPSEWYYNNTGGDRGVLNTGDIEYSCDGDLITATVINQSASWTWGGMWYSLNKIIRSEADGLDFNAIFGPYIVPEYQGQIIGLEIVVNDVSSSNPDLELRLEIKDKNDSVLKKLELGKLIPGTYPYTYRVDINPSDIGKAKAIYWIIDHAQIGDSVSIDRVRLKANIPEANELPTEEQAFLWTYSWLMGNYDQSTGMVQDRSNFESGVFENVTATAKAAKITYYAYKKGYLSYLNAENIITKIAETLINKVPRGPSGINTLWPHFTENGGTQIVAETEWASGDTAFAALDIITVLQMLEDPQNQMSALIQFLKDINWQDLLFSDGGISHGYTYNGTQIPYSWIGFGMETVGVNWAYASYTGSVAAMSLPPSDNGSGFIDNAHFPVVLSGIDHWNNDWDAYRNIMADKQIDWYSSEEHYNPYLSGAGLFGLSAAETPEADGTYTAYGTGNHVPPNDGNGEVVVLHYSGMIADIRPDEAKHVWEVLRDKEADFLQDKIALSPLNNMESMRVDKSIGECTINYLKGSWNLALQAEGWALMDADIRNTLLNAIYENDFLYDGYGEVKECSNVVISPTSFSAEDVNIGSSKTQTFTATNLGTGNLVIGTLSIGGSDASEFSIEDDNCSGQTIEPSGSRTVDVIFSPATEGSKSANLSIPSNDPDMPTLDVPLSGKGIIVQEMPTVTTGLATSVTADSTTLNGMVNPNGASTAYYFEYGTTTSYGSTTDSADAGSGTSDVSVSADITGLTPDTSCHFRIVATNIGGTSYGDDRTFITSLPTCTISGMVSEVAAGLGGVVMNGFSGNPTTDVDGGYSATVDYDWSGTVTPSKVGYTFDPSSQSYTNVTSDQLNQDYQATLLTYTLTVSVNNSKRGSVNKNPNKDSYTHGENVQLTATANASYHFDKWTGDVPSGHANDNPITITMESNKSITANFENCFIATAAYSSHSHPHVKMLRDFRDKYLIPSKIGLKMVDLYYMYSPYLADAIAKHKALKFMVRVSLLPIVAFSYMMVHFGPIIIVITFGIVLMLPKFYVLLRRKKIIKKSTIA